MQPPPAADVQDKDNKLGKSFLSKKKRLASHRQEKLNKELEEIENAIQYSLRASIDGYFPCHTCPDSTRTIYLYKGQVWRYGSTRKEENERYPGGNYGAPNIIFIPEFRGTIAECLRIEKIKIYKQRCE
jgi:hypothetical protein